MQVKKAVEECTRRDEQVAILTKEKLTAEKRCNQVNITIDPVRIACEQVMFVTGNVNLLQTLNVSTRLCEWADTGRAYLSLATAIFETI